MEKKHGGNAFREYRFVWGGATKEGNWRMGGFGSAGIWE